MKRVLNESQRAAVSHGEGPALVLAGPGSGKTTVITERAVRVAAMASSPDKLLCVTFTTAAAAEMRERYIRLSAPDAPGLTGGAVSRAGAGEGLTAGESCGKSARRVCTALSTGAGDGLAAGESCAGAENELPAEECDVERGTPVTPVFSTVHAYCNRIISIYERRRGVRFTRIEGEDSPKNAILSRIYKKYNGKEPDDAMLDRLKSYYRKESAKDGPGPAGGVARPAGRDQIRRFREIASEYEKVKSENNYIDFDDMITFGRSILENEADIAEEVRAGIEFVQVDEAQDLSREQYNVIRLLAPGGNIFVVADDDQSIYGFRGAEPECLFGFVDDYPDVARYMLTRNYRSTADIVRFSSLLVGRNGRRFQKDLVAADEADGGCGTRSLTAGGRSGSNERSQPVTIGGRSGSNERSRPVTIGGRSGIGRGTRSVTVIEPADNSAQATLCVREAARAAEAGETIAVLYRNGVSSLPVRAAVSEAGMAYSILGSCPPAWESDAVRDCFSVVAAAERNARFAIPTPAKTFRRLIRDGFATEAEEACRLEGRDRKNVCAAISFLEILLSGASSYSDAVGRLDRVERSDIDAATDPARRGIVLSTIHSAKGLEFDNVIILDLVEGELPGTAAAGAMLEEERRLLYVAMTRAKKRLILSCPRKRGVWGEERSSFVDEIMEDLRFNGERG